MNGFPAELADCLRNFVCQVSLMHKTGRNPHALIIAWSVRGNKRSSGSPQGRKSATRGSGIGKLACEKRNRGVGHLAASGPTHRGGASMSELASMVEGTGCPSTSSDRKIHVPSMRRRRSTWRAKPGQGANPVLRAMAACASAKRNPRSRTRWGESVAASGRYSTNVFTAFASPSRSRVSKALA